MKKALKVFAGVCSLALVISVLASLTIVAQTPNGIKGAFGGSVYVVPPHRLWFGSGIAGDVRLVKGAANTLALGPAAGAHLGNEASNPDFVGTCTLGTNCAVTFTSAYAAAPVCTATDTTAAAAVKVVTTTTTATFTGTGTDVIGYHCIAVTN